MTGSVTVAIILTKPYNELSIDAFSSHFLDSTNSMNQHDAHEIIIFDVYTIRTNKGRQFLTIYICKRISANSSDKKHNLHRTFFRYRKKQDQNFKYCPL